MAVSAPAFGGFSREAIEFLVELKDHNERAWFQPRKADFQRLLREPMENLVRTLGDRFAARGIPLQADPARSIFRIYRDTRFAKDKSPYKTHLAANFPWIGADGSVDGGAHANGGYFNFEPGNMYLGGGMWMPHKPRLDAFRRAVVADEARVRASLEDPAFLAFFGPVHSHESLKRVPAGFPPDHPRAEMLRFRDVIFGRRLSDEEVLSPDLPDLVAEGFAAALPVFRFLGSLEG